MKCLEVRIWVSNLVDDMELESVGESLQEQLPVICTDLDLDGAHEVQDVTFKVRHHARVRP